MESGILSVESSRIQDCVFVFCLIHLDLRLSLLIRWWQVKLGNNFINNFPRPVIIIIFWLENYANSQELLPVNSIYRELQAQKKFKSWMNLNGQIFCHLEPFLLFTIMPFRFSKASLPENLNYFSLISPRKQPTVSNHWRGHEMSVVFSGYSLIRVPKLRGHLSATMLCLTYVYVFFLPQSHCTQRKYTLVS